MTTIDELRDYHDHFHQKYETRSNWPTKFNCKIALIYADGDWDIADRWLNQGDHSTSDQILLYRLMHRVEQLGAKVEELERQLQEK